MRVKTPTRENLFSLRRFSLRQFWRRSFKSKVKKSPQKTTTPNFVQTTRISLAATREVPTTLTPAVNLESGSHTVLVGDIGGTNARLSLWRIENEEYKKISEQWYPTKEYKASGFESVLETFCTRNEVVENYPSSACFAIAGPVSNNKGTMTNLGWVINGDSIQNNFNWKVAVINDFEALGYGIPLLDEADLVPLNDVPVDPTAPKAVLGPGTGLGEAQLMWDETNGGYKVWPSEGAHADFAPRTQKQRELLEWITQGYGYCEVEHVACGSGLERIYTFLKSKGQTSVLDASLLSAPEVSREALLGEDQEAVEALDMMLSIVGAEAGHMGLRCLAHGGVYIAGGITPKVIDRVASGLVKEAFLHQQSHRFRSVLESFPLYAVLNEEVGLIGCRHHATQLLST